MIPPPCTHASGQSDHQDRGAGRPLHHTLVELSSSPRCRCRDALPCVKIGRVCAGEQGGGARGLPVAAAATSVPGLAVRFGQRPRVSLATRPAFAV
jgi:hypothetical protein